VNDPIFVVPWRRDLLNQLSGKAVVVVANGLDEMQTAIQVLDGMNVVLRCLVVRSKASLASISLKPEFANYPLAIYPSRLGRFQDLIRVLPILRKMNVRVYFCAEDKKNCEAIRILASLGIETVTTFESATVQWDLLKDLATYALLGIVPHAAIEPFHYIASRFNPKEPLEWDSVYFDDPSTYLNVDEQGRVALTRTDLIEGRFLALSPAEVTIESRSQALKEHYDSRSKFFLDRSPCAYCQGWRVCLGRFHAHKKKEQSCSEFFVELMDVIDCYNKGRGKQKDSVWQF